MRWVQTWAKNHVGVVAAWLGMGATLLISVGSHWTLAQVNQSRTDAHLSELDDKVEEHDGLIHQLRSDVRSISESQRRAIDVIERTDRGLRSLEQVTAELRALLTAHRGNK